EALFGETPGGEKNQAAQLIKFKIFMTLLLEGKDARAQKIMDQFKFTGDTPALYYAQAAWEFKHNNAAKAKDWIDSAKKIYSPALNLVFADSFYDVGWLQQPQNVAAAPVTPAKEVAKTETAAPPIEPSPIPAPALALNKAPKAPETALPKTITETTTQPPAAQPLAKTEKPPGPVTTNSPSVEMPSAANALPFETRAPLPREPESIPQPASSPATGPVTTNAVTERSPATGPATSTSNAVTQQSPASSPPNSAPAKAISSPATVLAPATVQAANVTESMNGSTSRTFLVGGLLAAGILLLVWVVYSEFRRRVSVSVYRSPAPASGPSFDAMEAEAPVQKMAAPKRLAGGPPQVSLHLKASEPSVRRGAVPLSKTSRPPGSSSGATTVAAAIESLVPRAPKVEKVEPAVIEPIAEVLTKPEAPAVSDFEREVTPTPVTEVAEFSSVGEPSVIEEPPKAVEPFEEIQPEPVFAKAPEIVEPVAPEPVWEPVTPEPAWTPMAFESAPATFEETAAPVEETPMPVVAESSAAFESVSEPMVIEPEVAPAAPEFSAEEPVAQGPPIPYQVPAFETDSPMAEITKPEPEELPAHLAKGVVAGTSMAGVGALRHSVESPSFAPQV
ncbi:MAG TPA: hypothetical protein VF511_09990, partial [Chthoniobacterales bacterium]